MPPINFQQVTSIYEQPGPALASVARIVVAHFRQHAALALCLFSLAVSAFPAVAQDDAQTVPAEPAVVAPQVSTAALAAQIDATGAELSRVLESLEVFDAALAGIPKQREALSEDLEASFSLLEAGEIESLSQAEADTLLQKFLRMERQLDEWEKLLQARSAQLEQQRERLRNQNDFIEAALAADASSELPAAQAERAAKLTSRLSDARESLGERLSVVLAEISQLTEFRVRLDDATQRTKASQQRAPLDLLERDRPMLWSALLAGRPSLSTLLENLRQRRDSSLEFVSAMGEELTVFFILGAVLIGGAQITRLRMVRAGKPASEQPLFIRSPLATAVLIWAVIGVELLLEPTPLAIGTLRVLAISLALTFLVPEMLGAAVRLPATLLVLMAALAHAADLLLLGGPLWRLLLLGVAITSLLGFLRLDRTLPVTVPAGKKIWLWIARGLTTLAPYALGLAILALVVGFSSMALTLVNGLLLTLIAVLGLLIIEQVLNDFFSFLLAYSSRLGLRSVSQRPAFIKQRSELAVRVLALILLASLLRQIFPILDLAWERFTGWLAGDLELGTASFAIGDLLVLLLALLISILTARLVRVLLAEDVFPRFQVASGAGEAISRLIYYGLVTAGILFALAASGVELTKLTLVISALGVGIGFGLQGIVNNFVSGLILSFERPIQVGDTIVAGALTGRVTQIGLRATRIRTFEGAEVIVPNADLISSNVVNWTLSDRTRRLDLPVQVAYGSDLERVREVLKQVAAEHPAVAAAPAPDVLFQGYRDNSLELWLRLWLPESGDWPAVRSQLYYAIDAALRDAGIEVPFPQRVVHLRDDRDGGGVSPP